MKGQCDLDYKTIFVNVVGLLFAMLLTAGVVDEVSGYAKTYTWKIREMINPFDNDDPTNDCPHEKIVKTHNHRFNEFFEEGVKWYHHSAIAV
jgi:hypothetical protein